MEPITAIRLIIFAAVCLFIVSSEGKAKRKDIPNILVDLMWVLLLLTLLITTFCKGDISMRNGKIIVCDRCDKRYMRNTKYRCWGPDPEKDGEVATGFSIIGMRSYPVNNKDLCDGCIRELVNWYTRLSENKEDKTEKGNDIFMRNGGYNDGTKA